MTETKKSLWWEDHHRAIPNIFVRTKLFRIGRTEIYDPNHIISFTTKSGSHNIRYRGPVLTQHVLDYLIEQCHRDYRDSFSREHDPDDRNVSLSLKPTCKSGAGGKDYERVKNYITLLHNAELYVNDVRYDFFRFRALFRESPGYVLISQNVRHALKRKSLAKWLHALISSHKPPIFYNLTTLQEWCGSTSTSSVFKKNLTQAVRDILAIDECNDWQMEISDRQFRVNSKGQRYENGNAKGNDHAGNPHAS